MADNKMGKITQIIGAVLDIKYTNDEDYRKNVGCAMKPVIEFLEYLNSLTIATTLRQVIIPTLNDSEESVLKLKKIREKHRCVDSVELLEQASEHDCTQDE